MLCGQATSRRIPTRSISHNAVPGVASSMAGQPIRRVTVLSGSSAAGPVQSSSGSLRWCVACSACADRSGHPVPPRSAPRISRPDQRVRSYRAQPGTTTEAMHTNHVDPSRTALWVASSWILPFLRHRLIGRGASMSRDRRSHPHRQPVCGVSLRISDAFCRGRSRWLGLAGPFSNTA